MSRIINIFSFGVRSILTCCAAQWSSPGYALPGQLDIACEYRPSSTFGPTKGTITSPKGQDSRSAMGILASRLATWPRCHEHVAHGTGQTPRPHRCLNLFLTRNTVLHFPYQRLGWRLVGGGQRGRFGNGDLVDRDSGGIDIRRSKGYGD
jgi:hypothetical protein